MYNAPAARLTVLLALLTLSDAVYSSPIAGGGRHTCAVMSTGEVKCWGSNAVGQLGVHPTSPIYSTYSPLDLADPNHSLYGMLTAATDHTCGITIQSQAKCWGEGQDGRLGNGSQVDLMVPGVVVNLPGHVSVISARARHTCAVTADGAARCWGANDSGQLGDGTTTMRLLPVDVVDLTSGVSSIATGTDHTCALLTSGAVKCWGSNQHGRLGDGTTQSRLTPVAVVGMQSGVVSLGAGDAHNCAVRNTGAVECWGNGNLGRLGNGSSDHQYVPVDVQGLPDGASDVSLGSVHTCARIYGGRLKCWGGNTDGQVGDGTNIDRFLPVDSAQGIDVAAVSAGHEHTCVVGRNDHVWCWGNSSVVVSHPIALGHGNATPSIDPVLVAGFTSSLAYVDAKARCGIQDSGKLMCWGRSAGGGVNSYTGPVDLYPSAPLGVQRVSASSYATGSSYPRHICIIDRTGGVMCAGTNSSGQLGNGTTTSSASFVPVLGMPEPAREIASGDEHNCALTESGAVWCWGRNYDGQLGVGGPGGLHLQAVQVTGLVLPARSISAGSHSTCALLDSGGVKCWGRNFYGQIGDGTTETRHVPTDVVSLAQGIEHVQTGGEHSCAVTSVGLVKCWGRNNYGQLGDESTQNRLTPVNVEQLDGVVDLGVGRSHACVTRSDRGVKCWGYNNGGQLGDGTRTNRPLPVDALEVGDVIQLSVGQHINCVVNGDLIAKCWGDVASTPAYTTPWTASTLAYPIPVWMSSAVEQILRNGFDP